MAITEIESVEDAKARLQRYFLSGQPETFAPRRFLSEHIDEYAALAFFLSNKPAFEQALEMASWLIWVEYNKPEIMISANRYTNAIASLGKCFGLSGQNSYVFINEAGALFGQLLKGGHLWKDSFAPGHGEFAHSYQWISWAAKNYKKIGELYKGTHLLSWLPMFVKAQGEIELRRVYLWEWLVDCTKYQPKFDAQVRAAVQKYLARIGPKHDMKDAEPWTRDLWWTEVEENVYKLQDEYKKANVLCADRYRNANNITDFVKRQEGWFIQAYELRRQKKIQTREQEQKVMAVHRLIGTGPVPSVQQQQQLAPLKPSQISSQLLQLGRGQKNPGNDIQLIDIGKDVTLHHYMAKQDGAVQQERGVGVRFDRTPPVGSLLKKQVRMFFHGMSGLMNQELS